MAADHLLGCLGNSSPIQTVHAHASGIKKLSFATRCRTQQAYNVLSKDGNQLPRTLLINLTLSDIMTARCVSTKTQRRRTIKRKENDHGYHDDASFPPFQSATPPSQKEMTKRNKGNESSQDKVASDTIDVFVPIHEDYSSAIESGDEAPKFVPPQRETKNKETTSDNDSNLFYSSDAGPSDKNADIIPVNANDYNSSSPSLCPANDIDADFLTPSSKVEADDSLSLHKNDVHASQSIFCAPTTGKMLKGSTNRPSLSFRKLCLKHKVDDILLSTKPSWERHATETVDNTTWLRREHHWKYSIKHYVICVAFKTRDFSRSPTYGMRHLRRGQDVGIFLPTSPDNALK